MLKNPPFQTRPQQSWPQPGEWTYADYQRLPDDARYEIIHGVLYEMAPPGTLHQLVVARLIAKLSAVIEGSNLGVLLPSPLEVILPDVGTPVQPDLVFVSQARRELIHENRIVGAPDLVIEILSPSSVRHDRRTKFDAYEQAGIPEYWVVNPKARSVEIYRLEDTQYTLAGENGMAESPVSPLFGELGFTAEAIFTT